MFGSCSFDCVYICIYDYMYGSHDFSKFIVFGLTSSLAMLAHISPRTIWFMDVYVCGRYIDTIYTYFGL